MPVNPNNSRLKAETLRSRAASSFNSSYQTLGSALAYPARIIKITNNTSVLCLISMDGVNAHEVLPAGSFILLDCSTNREVSNVYEIAANTQFYVNAAAGTGTIYLSVYYAG